VKKDGEPKIILGKLESLIDSTSNPGETTRKLPEIFFEVSKLLVLLSERAEVSTKKIEGLTSRIFWLTIFLAVVAFLQVTLMFVLK